MSVLRDFINSAPIKVDLDFGVNTNVVLRNVSIEPRMYQGTQIRRNTFMTFTQVNPITRKAIKEHEYSFFNLNHESEYVNQNMYGKLTKLVSIIEALGLDTVAAEVIFEKSLLTHGVSEVEKHVKTLKGAKLIDEALSTAFNSVIKETVGLDGPLVHFKTTVDKKGYLELPLYNDFIQPVVEGEKIKLKLVMKEIRAKEEAEKTKTAGADKLNKRPAAGKGGLSFSGLGIV